MIKRFIIVSVAIVMVLSYYFIVYKPTDRKLAEVAQQADAAQSQLDDFQKTVALLPDLIKQSAQLSEQRQRQAATLFGKNEVLRLVDDLRAEARYYALTVSDIEPPVSELLALRATADKPGEPLFLNITVRLKGEYGGFGRFVQRLESLPYFRGSNLCSIVGPPDMSTPPMFTFGFRALLGEGRRA